MYASSRGVTRNPKMVKFIFCYAYHNVDEFRLVYKFDGPVLFGLLVYRYYREIVMRKYVKKNICLNLARMYKRGVMKMVK